MNPTRSERVGMLIKVDKRGDVQRIECGQCHRSVGYTTVRCAHCGNWIMGGESKRVVA